MWDIKNESVITKYKRTDAIGDQTRDLSAIKYSPDGRSVLCGVPSELTILSLKDGSIVGKLPHNVGSVNDLEYSPDKSLLAVCGEVARSWLEVRITHRRIMPRYLRMAIPG